MNIILYIVLFILIYTIISIAWALKHLGDKYRKSPWYDWILYAPVLVIAVIFGFINSIFNIKIRK